MDIMTDINIKLVLMVIFDLWALKQILEVRGREMEMIYILAIITFSLNVYHQYMSGELNYFNLIGLINPITEFMFAISVFVVIISFKDHAYLLNKMLEDLVNVDERKITKKIIKKIAICGKYKRLLADPTKKIC